MNCHDTARSARYSEFSSHGEGWCASADDYYNENYLPNDGNLATMSSGTGGQQPPPSYNNYYDYHHQPPPPPPPHHEGSVIHSSSGTTPPPPPPHLHSSQHHHPHHHPSSHQVSNFPQKRSPSQEIVFNNNNNNNNNNSYNEPKSPSPSSVTTSPPWNSFHSFYHTKNPSASPTSNNSMGSSPPPTTIAPASSAEPEREGILVPGVGSPKSGRPSFKRRTTANKKERRRTQSINNAFADLRDCIPNVPADTKLSKIKTLRLATSYIAYLSEVLVGDDPLRTPQAFTAEISKKMGRGDEKRRKELLMQELAGAGMKPRHHHDTSENRKAKGRTGWPQHVWALELQQ